MRGQAAVVAVGYAPDPALRAYEVQSEINRPLRVRLQLVLTILRTRVILKTHHAIRRYHGISPGFRPRPISTKRGSTESEAVVSFLVDGWGGGTCFVDDSSRLRAAASAVYRFSTASLQ